MQKKLPPLSLKLKLILAYLYLVLAGNLAVVLGYALLPNQALNLDNAVLEHLTAIGSGAAITALATWAVYCFHKRSSQSTFAYVMLTIVSYGIYANTSMWVAASARSTESNLLSVALLLIDVGIAVFMFKSSEVKKQLKK